MDENPRTNDSGVDEEMEHLEQAIERGEARFPSAEEIHAFDNAVGEMLIDLANHRDKQTHNEEQSES